MIVTITSRAMADLREIATYLRQYDRPNAVRIVRDLRHACEALGPLPLRFPSAPQFGANVRRASKPPYVIFYRVDKTVDVLRIFHSARDYDKFLADDLPPDGG